MDLAFGLVQVNSAGAADIRVFMKSSWLKRMRDKMSGFATGLVFTVAVHHR
jgi:hypothetical protein